MISIIFDLIASLLDLGWRFLSSILGFAWKLLTALLDFGARAVSAMARMLFSPLTRGMDSLWDAGVFQSWNLGSLIAAVLTILLIACAVFALIAAGENLYRKYKHRKN